MKQSNECHAVVCNDLNVRNVVSFIAFLPFALCAGLVVSFVVSYFNELLAFTILINCVLSFVASLIFCNVAILRELISRPRRRIERRLGAYVENVVGTFIDEVQS